MRRLLGHVCECLHVPYIWGEVRTTEKSGAGTLTTLIVEGGLVWPVVLVDLT
jgi:hypothetical protein